MIAEGSVSGVMEGRKYNRVVRLHKLVYQALMRQVWSRFQKCVAEKHDEETSLIVVDEMFLVFRVCVMFANLSSRRNFAKTLLTKLFERYMSFLRCKNSFYRKFVFCSACICIEHSYDCVKPFTF